MISEVVTRFVLPWLVLILFLLVVLRNPLKRLFRQIMKVEQDASDDDFQEIVKREKQRMQEEAARDQRSHPDGPAETNLSSLPE